MAQLELLGLAGALRQESTNRLLVREAARLANASGFVEADLALPLYDGDLEDSQGIPAAVQTLADQIAAADAVVISTPEYNQGISGVLKNALDWVSRTEGGVWKGKPVAVMSAAAGRAGGARAQYALRLAMQPFNTRLLQGPEVMIAACDKQFDDDGHLTDESYIRSLTNLMAALQAEVALTR